MTVTATGSVVDVARDRGAAAALALLCADVSCDAVPFGPRGLAVRPDGSVARGPVAEPTDAWAVGVLWLRLGLSERLLATGVGYLADRDSLLGRQLVRDAIAEALLGQWEVRAALTGARHLRPAMACWLHDLLSDVDNAALRLLGANGFAGAGDDVEVSETLAAAYRPEVG
jgi:hypothetical protein